MLQPIETITGILSTIITIFQHRMVHFTLSQCFFSQIFSWIGSMILKAFMLRQAFCTDQFALFVKQKIDLLISWSENFGNVWCGNISKSFVQVREVIAVLTYKEKDKFAEEKTRKIICPNLNANQLKQILAMYSPGEFGKKVPTKVITSICPPTKALLNQQLFDSEKLLPIPIEALHYLETSDIKGLSLPSSIRTSIETEIKNIKKLIISKNVNNTPI
ncbi:hypothetical protein DICPUDRAFT_92763 [Dictyostelium purpureum]|uniref:Dilute domain-containing protein n=1 Tax=Dictyostelium purpureum TaxID=5786 RepID=F0ZWT7_DICPU|nr:uncharacterized protein DICPUDRAFT_92763 [Dictyostelium purpureum]EGC31597.1 hypothetical protein DICPUDRAFT_92763 [Dictyostelium purpureum]|eukprot:XP_003291881.1 hypothetical protein DICPUDRAFT_92763 [Dictyostelium purpureum]